MARVADCISCVGICCKVAKTKWIAVTHPVVERLGGVDGAGTAPDLAAGAAEAASAGAAAALHLLGRRPKRQLFQEVIGVVGRVADGIGLGVAVAPAAAQARAHPPPRLLQHRRLALVVALLWRLILLRNSQQQPLVSHYLSQTSK